MKLVGERVVLRPPRADDAEFLARALREDPATAAMLGMSPEEATAESLRGTWQDQGEPPASYWFVVVDSVSSELIGEIGLVGISRPNRRAGLSVLVLPAFRGAGVAREAIELLVRWAQNELDVHRMEVHTYPENLAMQRVAEAAGFQREGVLRDYAFEGGRFRDNVMYARLRTA